MFSEFKKWLFLPLILVLAGMLVQSSLNPAHAKDRRAIVPRIEISEPKPGQALQGSVRIIGSTNIRNFHRSELAFSYQNNPTDTWFILAESDQGVVDEVLAIWDTTVITDNIYQLRLTVTTKDAQRHVYMVEGLRVRNYTAIETDTPQPQPERQDTFENATTPQATQPVNTPTPLPTNPLNLSHTDLTQSALKGVGIATLLFLLGIVIAIFRKG